MTNSQNGNGMGQIIAAVLLTLIAGGTAPWWWDKFFAGESSPNTSIEDPSGQNSSSAPESSGDSVDQGQQSFKASQRNGVLSKEYSAYGSSFVVLP